MAPSMRALAPSPAITLLRETSAFNPSFKVNFTVTISSLARGHLGSLLHATNNLLHIFRRSAIPFELRRRNFFRERWEGVSPARDLCVLGTDGARGENGRRV